METNEIKIVIGSWGSYSECNDSLFKDLETVGEYSMPKIKPVTDAKILNLITFNYAKTCKSPGCYHVCFFVDDYQFERI